MNVEVELSGRSLWGRLRWPAVLLAVAAVPLGLLAALQAKLIYLPRPYPPGAVDSWRKSTGGRILEFESSQGRQRAYLQGRLQDPEFLWIVCGGNAMRALDWSDWLSAYAPPEDAWLLFDYPGYGECGGAPDPDRIRESLRIVVPMAMEATGLSLGDRSRVRFLGFSLGAAAALIAADEFGLQRGVLLAPFTSTMDMCRRMLGLPLGFLVTHRFDNAARLDALAGRGPGRVIVLHGTADTVIPVAMSRELAARRPDVVRLQELPGELHNTILDSAADRVAAALNAARMP